MKQIKKDNYIIMKSQLKKLGLTLAVVTISLTHSISDLEDSVEVSLEGCLSADVSDKN